VFICVNPWLSCLPYIDRVLQISSYKEGITVKRLFVMVLLAVASITFGSQQARAQMDDNPMVGGAPMFKAKDIVDNAVNSADHTTLVAAVKAAGLVETLKSKGPFTVFAPVNSAFDKRTTWCQDVLTRTHSQRRSRRAMAKHG
jgi:uncharacterized surface protein with fasciclin (FAS1) repeats